MDLNDRKRKILQAIIDEYIGTAEPVGSRAISKKENLGLSSATIRNEMADLEEMGYLIQPHTSAVLDRIPAEGNVRQHGFPAVGIQIAPAVHRVELIRVALPQRGEAFGNVGQQHAFVEPIGNVVEEIVVVEIIRHFALGRLVKIGQRFHVHAVEHAAHVVRREGHIHHLLMVEGGTRVDAKLDKLPAEKAV